MIRTLSTILLVALAGCAAHPDPIVDTKGVDPQQLARDWSECEAYTEQIALGQGVAKGSAAGAVVACGSDFGASPCDAPPPWATALPAVNAIAPAVRSMTRSFFMASSSV